MLSRTYFLFLVFLMLGALCWLSARVPPSTQRELASQTHALLTQEPPIATLQQTLTTELLDVPLPFNDLPDTRDLLTHAFQQMQALRDHGPQNEAAGPFKGYFRFQVVSSGKNHDEARIVSAIGVRQPVTGLLLRLGAPIDVETVNPDQQPINKSLVIESLDH